MGLKRVNLRGIESRSNRGCWSASRGGKFTIWIERNRRRAAGEEAAERGHTLAEGMVAYSGREPGSKEIIREGREGPLI